MQGDVANGKPLANMVMNEKRTSSGELEAQNENGNGAKGMEMCGDSHQPPPFVMKSFR
jgi:hypothetical protein